MQYSKEDQVYSLYFSYNGENIAFLDKKMSVTSGGMILLRNYSYEQEIGETVLKEIHQTCGKSLYLLWA